MNDKTLTLFIPNAGLGDHLFYSHIPRIAKETGVYRRVLISNESNFRNKAYKKLVWELNPYIDGFVDRPGKSAEGIFVPSDNYNILDNKMLSFGLDDGKRMHDPELYYKPKIISGFESASVYDPNYITSAGFVSAFKVSGYFKKHVIIPDFQMRILGKRAVPILSFGAFLGAASIWDFVDILSSVKEIYCLVTGTATLAAAIGKKAHVFYTPSQDPMFRHSSLHTYISL